MMPKKPRPKIGITLGDPAGIGPEIIARCLKSRSLLKTSDFVVIGSQDIIQKSGLRETDRCRFDDPFPLKPKDVRPGQSNDLCAQASLRYIERAIDLIKKREIDAIVTGPVSKEAISALGKKFQGHTEFLASAFGVKKFEMMFVSKKMRTIVVTRHIPIKRLCRAITKEKVYSTILLADEALRKFYKIKQPNIGVCGLNPHAGEGGRIGDEEIKHILPAIKKAQKKGIRASGPYAADTLFSPMTSGSFDLIVTMYHDQGLIPVKTLYFNELVNVTVGLPFPRTSPAHGTAYNIAGQGKADPCPMKTAIEIAVEMCP